MKNQAVNPDLVDINMDDKMQMIEEVLALDEGFESDCLTWLKSQIG